MKIEIYDPHNNQTLAVGDLESVPRVGDFVYVRHAGPTTSKAMEVIRVEWMIDDTEASPPERAHAHPARVFVKV